MRVKLSNELTDGLFSPRKNNRINLLDKQLQESGWTSAVSGEGGHTPGEFQSEKTFCTNKQKKREAKRGEIKKQNNARL